MSHLVWWEVSLPVAGNYNQVIPSIPNPSAILRFYALLFPR